MSFYDAQFFKTVQEGSRASAEVIIPIVLKLVQPHSVVDIGCGTGEWLSVCKTHGIDDIWGVDGDWVDADMLQIPAERFMPCDLRKPVPIDRTFDLALSLEVAEHIPKEYAHIFVGSLTSLSPVVLFSAAIPSQDGKDHVNEQWPEYWVNLFAEKGFVVVDCIRKQIWDNDKVECWYAQNVLLFVQEEHVDRNHLLRQEFELNQGNILSIVHPRSYIRKSRRDYQSISFKRAISTLPLLLLKGLKHKTREILTSLNKTTTM